MTILASDVILDFFFSGFCICKHNTTGSNCELCAKGFYGNAIAGTPDDCKPCPCPKDSGCIQLMDGSIVCTDCPEGYAGKNLSSNILLGVKSLSIFVPSEVI